MAVKSEMDKKLAMYRKRIQTDMSNRLMGNAEHPNDKELAALVEHYLKQYEAADAINYGERGRDEFIRSCINDFAHLGPLEDLLAHPDVTEIMVNGADQVYVEMGGKLVEVVCDFDDNDHVKRIIDRIVQSVNRHIDEQTPYVDARLKDGSRVNATIPPISVDYPTLTIRKFSEQKLTWDDYLSWGAISENMVRFLSGAVLARCNILVTGGTGSGKCVRMFDSVYSIDDNGHLIKKQVGSISVGDKVIARNGQATEVIGVYPQGKLPVWEVVLKDGRIIEVNDEHLWSVAMESHGAYVERTISTKEMLERGISTEKAGGHTKSHFWIPRVRPIESENVGLPMDAWFVGYMIGNGCMTHSYAIEASTPDAWTVQEIQRIVGSNHDVKRYENREYSWNIVPAQPWLDKFIDLGLNVHSHEKFIPDVYKYSGLEQRKDLFAGLLDADGSCSEKGHVSYCSVSERLAEDVLELGRSLGFTGRITKDVRDDGQYANTDGVCYNVHFTGAPFNPFHLPRKADRWADAHEVHMRDQQSFVDGGAHGYTADEAYLAGFFFTCKFVNSVPYLKASKLSGDIIEGLFDKLGEGTALGGESAGVMRVIGAGATKRRNPMSKWSKEHLPYCSDKIMDREVPAGLEHSAEFLRGLADYAGAVAGGAMRFYASGGQSASIQKLIEGVGLKCVVVKDKRNGSEEITVYGYPTELTNAPEKRAMLDAWKNGASGSLRDDYVPIVDIRMTDRTEEMVCIKVADPSHTFVLGDGTVTHNTTLLNVLSNEIPTSQRIITIEDAAELQLAQPHVVRFETRRPNNEGAGQVSIHDLIVNSLRMRPDRIIVGECRSEEAIEMLQAMNTGHDGSLTTVHANSPTAAFERLETMVLQGADLPSMAIKRQIATAIDVIVHTQRMLDGSRKITSIGTVSSHLEGEAIPFSELFRFDISSIEEAGDSRKVLGNYVGCGMPTDNVLEKFAAIGLDCDPQWFL